MYFVKDVFFFFFFFMLDVIFVCLFFLKKLFDLKLKQKGMQELTVIPIDRYTCFYKHIISVSIQMSCINIMCVYKCVLFFFFFIKLKEICVIYAHMLCCCKSIF